MSCSQKTFIRAHSNALPSSIRGGGRVREFRSRGSVRGAAGNDRLYRERALPVQTVSRNCMKDEGRSFGFGNQVLIPTPPCVQNAFVRSAVEGLAALSSNFSKVGSRPAAA